MNETEKEHFLHFINDGKYKDALLSFRSQPQDRPEFIRELANDAIIDALTKFRDNNDDDLRELVLLLFEAVHPESLKFRICFNFITGRTSHHLNEVLIKQLSSILTGSFRESHPADWEEFRDVLPVKLADNLPTSKNDNLLDAALETARILFSFKGIPFAIPGRMSEAFTKAMYNLELDLPNAFPFLVLFSKSHPFSPKLVGITSPTVLIPSVYHRHFLARQLVESLRIYVEESEYSRENHYIQPMVTTLDVILNNLREMSSSDIDPCADMILCLLSFIEDFELHFFRLPIMTKCQDIIHLFPSQLRCLLLKLIVSRLIEDDEVDFDNESNLVAWFIDLYRKYLDEESFRKELGSFLGILEDVRYNDMLEATNFYSSVFCLVQFIAMTGFNSAMLSEVETRLIGKIHDQLKDYIRLEEMRERDKKQRKEIERIPKEVQLQLKLAPEEPVVDQLQLVMFGCEQAKKCIADAIERSK
ncbi:hypothetical protein V3C99_003887 [Haemonchus contortus]